MDISKLSLDFRVRFAYAKGRNIIYYYDLDNLIRPRATYFHILRKYREELVDLLKILPPTNNYYTLFVNIVNQIGPKIKTTDCNLVINSIKNLYK